TATRGVTVSSSDAAPVAALSVSPSSVKVGQSVAADGSASTDIDATPIATYSFDWGDGSAATGPKPGATAAHAYVSAGTYTVTVTDTAGNASTATAQAVLRQNLAANFGFETNLTGWNTSGGATGIMLARVAGGRSGAWSAQLNNANATPATTLLNDSPNWVT